ncbi:alpha/beta hydrolase family esterase [Yoonia vestfoldensis]|uniref:alpha/beta hydrolase family esterase n=1 Tax=Yoonia vestfoldensis TaxID=245188 RepID=UPI0013A5525F|nr:alpha/beta fold hydrolase [Yoonia vestfoldensis]
MADAFGGRPVTLTDGRTDPAAAPLIVALHGAGGTAANMQRKTGFDAIAARHQLVIAYPNVERRRWRDGRDSDDATDVAYLAALIEMLIADGRADPARVYLVGHSNGGGMAMRMACDRPDLIAGIAVVSTNLLTAYPCEGGTSVPAIFFHGSADPITPAQGRAEDHRFGGAYSVARTLEVWATRNRCRQPTLLQSLDAVDDGTTVDLIRYAGCRAPLVHVQIDGHGHGWPGTRLRPLRLLGPATREVDAAPLIWWFFDKM